LVFFRVFHWEITSWKECREMSLLTKYHTVSHCGTEQ
jgi:hypothetical protein